MSLLLFLVSNTDAVLSSIKLGAFEFKFSTFSTSGQKVSNTCGSKSQATHGTLASVGRQIGCD
jgi:hypothetical protein